ncbi:MAG: HEPN domain-containing protein [bacterium]
MGKKLEAQFQECIEQRKITRLSAAKELVDKELRAARGDLETAQTGMKDKRWKWCTIQAYYSMFHAARALIYSAGYREKSHHCLRVAVEALFVKKGALEEKHVDALQVAKIMRENADYEEEFTHEGAQKIVKAAQEFIEAAETLLIK